MRELRIVIEDPKAIEGAKDPVGNVSGEARYLDCEIITAYDQAGNKLDEWRTPLCSWTEQRIAERLSAVGYRAAASFVLGKFEVVDGRSEAEKGPGLTKCGRPKEDDSERGAVCADADVGDLSPNGEGDAAS